MDETPKIGKLIEGHAYRDAIHVAIAPVEAAERLSPGDHVALTTDDGRACWTVERGVGIVDPFLLGDVREGERFYIFLYPGTVTSIRHSWTHPEFKAKVPNGQA